MNASTEHQQDTVRGDKYTVCICIGMVSSVKYAFKQLIKSCLSNKLTDWLPVQIIFCGICNSKETSIIETLLLLYRYNTDPQG